MERYDIIEEDIMDIIHDHLVEFNNEQIAQGAMAANINYTLEYISLAIGHQVFIITVREIIPVQGEP